MGGMLASHSQITGLVQLREITERLHINARPDKLQVSSSVMN